MENKCELCNAFNGRHGYIKTNLGEFTICPNMSQEQIKEQLILYIDVFNKFSERENENNSRNKITVNNISKDRNYWKGRFYELKHENNQLRKQINLWKLQKEQN